MICLFLVQMIPLWCSPSFQWLQPACTSYCLWVDLKAHRNAVHCWGLGKSVMETEKPGPGLKHVWDIDKGAVRMPRVFWHLWLEVGGNSKQLQQVLADAPGWQSRGVLFCFCFKRNCHIREKRRGLQQILCCVCLQVKGFIVTFQLAGCRWHLSLSC